MNDFNEFNDSNDLNNGQMTTDNGRVHRKRSRSSDILASSDSRTTSRVNRAETGFEGDLCSIAVHPLSAADTLLLPAA